MNYYLKTYKGRVANAKISLDQPIIIQTLLGNIKNHFSTKHSEPLAAFDSLYFWDLGKNASKHVKIGDTLYIKTQDDIYWGSIEVHIHDHEGGIGDAIGWARQFKSPWQNPIGLKGIKKTIITTKIAAIR